MHIMFVNPGFPAQFGNLAHHLVTELGWRCTYVTSADTRHLQLSFDRIHYPGQVTPLPPGVPNHGNLHVLFEHMNAVYRTLKSLPQVQPDVVVGHLFYGTLLYLKTLY